MTSIMHQTVNRSRCSRVPALRFVFSTVLLLQLQLHLSSTTYCDAFQSRIHSTLSIRRQETKLESQLHGNFDGTDEEDETLIAMIAPALPFQSALSRRQVIASTSTAVTAVSLMLSQQSANAIDFPSIFVDKENSPYQPSKRPLVYRIDSTIPPTLLPVSNPKLTLQQLGQGSGTDKNQIIIDTVNLNNILNKIVFGTIRAVQKPSFLQPQVPSTPSFVCLGMPMVPADTDVQLAQSLITSMVGGQTKGQQQDTSNTALGLAWAPYETQTALDEYAHNRMSLDDLIITLQQAKVSPETIQLYTPLLKYAASARLTLLALAPSILDVQSILRGGLQAVDPDQRSKYVIDPNGFIKMTADPAFQMYTDRSLLKQDETAETSTSKSNNMANLFAASILIHEAAATKMAQYAASKTLLQPLVIMVAPMADVRYQLGMNGRIPRIYNALVAAQQQPAASADPLSAEQQLMTTDRVTTILLNPNANDTLSKSKRLRLEIGTGPETLDYQQKIADYLWFSESPKVNLIPRLMNG
ncbi:hypothetical protein MPSEU_000879600 [Mayamaea pseudoterrestris]|nr:hypothetical protein MPSEU_000879600 [Mayamaea pseudoterrestris]